MTKILALSGKKQSGKNTTFNFLLGIELLKLAIVRDKVEITNKGQLRISDIFGDKDFAGIFDIDRHTKAMQNFRTEYIYPFIKNYSFADKLKRDVCINLLGLTYEQCYGTDEQKKSTTHLRWEDMPGVITQKPIDLAWSMTQGYTEEKYQVDQIVGRLGKYYEKIDGIVYHKPGHMTAREVMQYVGTGIFRKMYSAVWSESTVKQIQKDESSFAIITDCRFPDEVEAVKNAGGKVLRLTRNKDSEDTHESEIALDEQNYSWHNFDAIVNNDNMTISETNKHIHDLLVKWEWLEPVNLGE